MEFWNWLWTNFIAEHLAAVICGMIILLFWILSWSERPMQKPTAEEERSLRKRIMRAIGMTQSRD